MLALSNPVVPSSEVTVAAVGDILLHDAVQQEAGRARGFAGLWADVAGLLAGADVAYANLEGPLADGVTADGRLVDHPVGVYDGLVYSGYPMFNYPSTVATAMADSGIDVVSTANNHALDRYGVGVDRTLAALQAAGVAATGTRPSSAPDRPWHAVTTAGPYRIAWLACTYGTNGIADPDRQVLTCYDDRQAVLDGIAGLAADPAIDAVIFTPHWGQEYSHDPLPRQRELARQAVDAGAVAVIGNHPHVLQPVEIRRRADGREAPIAYSLGNFVSNQSALARRSSVILLLSLAEGTDGRLLAAGVRWVPVRVDFSVQPDGRRIRVAPIAEVGASGAAERDHIVSILGTSGLAWPTVGPRPALRPCGAPAPSVDAAARGAG